MSAPNLPQASIHGLLTEDVGEKLVVFDIESNVAHCLTPTVAKVWRGCDGNHDQVALANLSAVRDDVLADALVELEAKGLMRAADPTPSLDGSPGVSRRSALRRIGVAGLAVTSVPLIFSAAIGTYLAHASGGNAPQCGICILNGASDTCAGGLKCDPTHLVCIPTNCNFSGCTTGNLCSDGIVAGTCATGCASGGTLCCT